MNIFQRFYFLQLFDTADDLKSKVWHLAAAVKQAKHLVVYAGAGISTVRNSHLCSLKLYFKIFCLAKLLLLLLFLMVGGIHP